MSWLSAVIVQLTNKEFEMETRREFLGQVVGAVGIAWSLKPQKECKTCDEYWKGNLPGISLETSYSTTTLDPSVPRSQTCKYCGLQVKSYDMKSKSWITIQGSCCLHCKEIIETWVQIDSRIWMNPETHTVVALHERY